MSATPASDREYEHYRWANPTCPECGRVFDLSDPDDCDELAYGHDCEAS